VALECPVSLAVLADAMIGPMNRWLPRHPSALRRAISLAAIAIAMVSTSTALAESKQTYVFTVDKLDSKVPTPEAVMTTVREALAKKIEASDRLQADLPADAPDPATAEKKFIAFLAKRNMRAFRVHVEITEYELSEEEARSGKNVVVRVALRMFGETVPKRTMAFTGDGSAMIKLGVGKNVRPKDREVANRDAIELAIDDALATSIKKLEEEPKKKRSKKKR